MVLKRKIYDKMKRLKGELKGSKALLIEGARRIGKSTVCEEFARNEYIIYENAVFCLWEQIKGGAVAVATAPFLFSYLITLPPGLP